MSSDTDTNQNSMEKELPFLSHLIELRDRLLRAVVFILLIFLLLFSFANDIYHQLAAPLLASLPQGSTMIATGVASPFLTPFKLSLVLSVFIAMPYLLYQLWGFIAPGLYKHEKRLAFPILASSVVLFYAGMVFAYFIVFPLMFAFFTATTPEGVEMMTDISQYLDFILKMFFAFGVAFEVPIATILLTITGVTTPDKLVKKRPYIIVGAFVVGMLLTPPDIVSQTLLAIPVWLLFELGVIFSRIINRKSSSDSNKSKAEETEVKTSTTHDPNDDPDLAEQITDEEMERELDELDKAEDSKPS
jgi:sec-independent protein translocase protein TatC